MDRCFHPPPDLEREKEEGKRKQGRRKGKEFEKLIATEYTTV
jgi:hypothetical protein